MGDFYGQGLKDGYGKPTYGEREYPMNDGDRWSYERGLEDGRRRRSYRDEEDY